MSKTALEHKPPTSSSSFPPPHAEEDVPPIDIQEIPEAPSTAPSTPRMAAPAPARLTVEMDLPPQDFIDSIQRAAGRPLQSYEVANQWIEAQKTKQIREYQEQNEALLARIKKLEEEQRASSSPTTTSLSEHAHTHDSYVGSARLIENAKRIIIDY